MWCRNIVVLSKTKIVILAQTRHRLNVLTPFVAECRMYVIQQESRSSGVGLTCRDNNAFFYDQQFVNPDDSTYHNMGPESPYMQAHSVCCGGCTQIQPADEVCTGPDMPSG